MPSEILIINREDLPELAKWLAPMIKDSLSKTESDPYLKPQQLSELIPTLSATTIKSQIRSGNYGKRIGPKGVFVAKASEVRKYNRL